MSPSPAVRPAGAPPDARTRLLAAAVDAFADRGFHGTTTRDIAAAAGMSPAALYVHHRSKEELLYLIAVAGHQRDAGPRPARPRPLGRPGRAARAGRRRTSPASTRWPTPAPGS